jgi:tetratricopeptide (TPR) repeat protein
MTRDNILFSIIGVLFGFIVGFLFAHNVNQRGLAPRAASSTSVSSAQNSELPPDHPSVQSDAGEDQGAAAQESEAALQMARSRPGDFDAQVAAARILYENRQYDQAIELFLRANQLRPDSYETITALGNTYFDAGRFEDAEKWYTTALSRKPDDVNVRTDLGLSFFFRKPPDMERAIKEFRTSLKTDPNHEQTLINLAVVLSEKGATKEAQATLAQLEKVSPNNPALPKLRERIEATANK